MSVAIARRLLVVDDEPSTVSGLQALLEQDGYEVVGVESSGVALRLLDGGTFDAVITDLEMPVIGGAEIVRQARAARPPVHVLVVTGYGGSPAAAAALALGARRVFDKPIDYDALASELATALEGDSVERSRFG